MYGWLRHTTQSGVHNFFSFYGTLTFHLQGCLKPIEIKIPPGSLLDPSEDAAVIGGNVLTSQRVVDVVFKAFSACAASQGCMNNTTFGDDSFGYYETVAGGAGAVSCVVIPEHNYANNIFRDLHGMEDVEYILT